MTSKRNKTGPILAARAVAVRNLIAAHEDEYDALMVSACAAEGIEYVKQPTKEDLARQQIDAILAKNPGLRAEYAATALPFEPSGLDEFAPKGSTTAA